MNYAKVNPSYNHTRNYQKSTITDYGKIKCPLVRIYARLMVIKTDNNKAKSKTVTLHYQIDK